jgi:hypothetical protein
MIQECVNPISENKSRKQSMQLRAVLNLISVDPELVRVALKFIDIPNESILWEEMLNQDLTREHRIALEWAKLIWTDRLPASSAKFYDDTLDLERALKSSILRALSMRWGI